MIEKICDEIGITSNELIIKSLQEENKKQKEVIEKITNAIKNEIDGFITINNYGECNDILELLELYLDILKGGNND